jgi:hypothetical protein
VPSVDNSSSGTLAEEPFLAEKKVGNPGAGSCLAKSGKASV